MTETIDIDGATLTVLWETDGAGPGLRAITYPVVVGAIVHDLEAFRYAYGTDLHVVEFFERNPGELDGLFADDVRRCGFDD